MIRSRPRSVTPRSAMKAARSSGSSWARSSSSLASMARASGASGPERIGDSSPWVVLSTTTCGLSVRRPNDRSGFLSSSESPSVAIELARLERGLDPLDDVELLLLGLPVGPAFLDAGLEPLDAVGDDAQVGEEHLLAEGRQLGGRVAAGEPTGRSGGRRPRGSGPGAGDCRRASPASGRACRGTRRWPASPSWGCAATPGNRAGGRPARPPPPARNGPCRDRRPSRSGAGRACFCRCPRNRRVPLACSRDPLRRPGIEKPHVTAPRPGRPDAAASARPVALRTCSGDSAASRGSRSSSSRVLRSRSRWPNRTR